MMTTKGKVLFLLFFSLFKLVIDYIISEKEINVINAFWAIITGVLALIIMHFIEGYKKANK